MKRRDFLTAGIMAAAAQAPLTRAAAALPYEAEPPADPAVRRVFLIAKCHLDVGFTDTQANVMQQYFKDFFPRAITTAETVRNAGDLRYTWTTGSWILYEYLEQASAAERKRVEAAVAAHEIAWHALPFSWQTEMLDPSMIEGCLGFSQELDGRFGTKTVAAKMTDVPGHSRGLVGVLASSGVEILDIGVNAASAPPEVPDVFEWKEPSGKSVTMLYHRHDYGGVLRIPNSDMAVAVEMRVDNTGPHTPEEIADLYKKLQKQFPNAKITASSLTDVAIALREVKGKLPVITQEIGDTWIYGVPSDPPKVARYREMARLRKSWLAKRVFVCGDATDRQLLRRLALAPEHTWGTDTKRYIDHVNYAPTQLAENLAKPGYQTMERSWQEKREDIDAAIATLPEALRTEAQVRMQTLFAQKPSAGALTSISANGPITTEHFVIGVDEKTGCITHLAERGSKHSWASPANPLAAFSYQTLTQQDYTSYRARYVQSNEWWAKFDFGKPDIEKFAVVSRSWSTRLISLKREETTSGELVALELAMEPIAPEQKQLTAPPERIAIEMSFPKDRPVVDMNLWTTGKRPNRMPEAMWLSFHPMTVGSPTWVMEKVEQPVLATDVVRGGGRAMHAVTEAIWCRDGKREIEFRTLDAPVIALGDKSPLNYSTALPDAGSGMHVCLFNNAWGTNYPQWAGGDWQYRFQIKLKA